METKDLSEVFNDFLKETRPTSVPTDPTNSNPTTSVNVDPQVQTRTETTLPSGEQPGTSAAVPEVVNSTAQPEVTASEDDSWDSFVTEKETGNAAQPQVDWSEIGKAIGKTDVKTPEDLTGYISNLEKTVSDLKTNPVYGENIPKQLQEAIDIANKGGDYLAYLDVASVNYAEIDPVELYEDEVANFFYNADGSFREQEYLDYLDKQDPTDKMLRGKQIQRELIQVQDSNKQSLKQKVAAEKTENLRRLETSLDKFSKVGNFEVTPKVKKQLFDDLATGKFMSELGINLNGSHNWELLQQAYFKAKYFDAVQAFNEKRAATGTLRGEINKLSNSTVLQPSGISNPVTAPKVKSGIDLYFEKNNIK